jgi:hypothetical protein
MSEYVWDIGGIKLTGEEPKHSQRNVSQCGVHHKVRMDWHEFEPGPPPWEAGD